ncbi:MAG TPA: alpha/beta fold hydrolase [Acidimicrobiales bacterium]|jgi:alpha-beta hydrolase superfamily lysophospholipase|nr:alpha/beta fold hydrolase [Acidimicrobiales bacterium]
MHDRELMVEDPDGLSSVVYGWRSPQEPPRAVVHILHGWAEHALRYDRLAQRLVAAGFAVFADDHRGHGQTGKRSGTLGDLGPRGMDGVLDAVRSVIERVRTEHPDVPLFVLGHSWGSFILQRYLRRWAAADGLAGAVLTGTTYRDPSAPPAERRPPNEAFEPARTAYDWLSRDEAEVDAYIADELCGFEMMRSRPGGGGAASTIDDERPIPPELPILVLNGAADPIGGAAGGEALFEHYRSQGLSDVTLRAYDGARHELFNEINRDEVTGDLLGWLVARTP